jgi:hypothetical protein
VAKGGLINLFSTISSGRHGNIRCRHDRGSIRRSRNSAAKCAAPVIRCHAKIGAPVVAIESTVGKRRAQAVAQVQKRAREGARIPRGHLRMAFSSHWPAPQMRMPCLRIDVPGSPRNNRPVAYTAPVKFERAGRRPQRAPNHVNDLCPTQGAQWLPVEDALDRDLLPSPGGLTFSSSCAIANMPVVAQKPIRSQRMLIRDRDSRPCSEICPFSESGHRDRQNRESQS